MEEVSWVEANNGYQLGLRDGKLVCRNAKGKELKSVPKKVREGEVGSELRELAKWLGERKQECAFAVQTWMLRSLDVPLELLCAVWPDLAWQGACLNAWVKVANNQGFLRDVDDSGRVGLVDIDGETKRVRAKTVSFPHPVLIEDVDDARELATDLSLGQGISQLYRETFVRTKKDSEQKSIENFSEGKFNALMHAVGKANALGYKVSGGFATCAVWENNKLTTARYWIGSDAPDYETYTGNLLWVDAAQKVVPVDDVSAIAYSEGMRMASLIYAARVIEKEGENE